MKAFKKAAAFFTVICHLMKKTMSSQKMKASPILLHLLFFTLRRLNQVHLFIFKPVDCLKGRKVYLGFTSSPPPYCHCNSSTIPLL
jgi:hypothetical protein